MTLIMNPQAVILSAGITTELSALSQRRKVRGGVNIFLFIPQNPTIQESVLKWS